jgi:prepilin-type N-terminal cleavage/methylation domain-containing protein
MKTIKQAFTLVELVFVIVIIGILAIVAVPRLAGTRDDAIISKLSHSIQTSRVEIMSEIVTSGVVPTTLLGGVNGLDRYSNVVNELSNGILNIKVVNGVALISGQVVNFRAENGNGGMETCCVLEVNATDMQIRNPVVTSSICKGVQSFISEVTLPVVATRVVF